MGKLRAAQAISSIGGGDGNGEGRQRLQMRHLLRSRLSSIPWCRMLHCAQLISGAPLHSLVAHAGNAEVSAEIASELLRASDQYLLEGLKRLCEMRIAQSLSLDTLIPTFELSEAFSAPQLARRCILFVLEHYDAFLEMHGADMLHDLMLRMVPQVRQSMLEDTAEQPPSQES